MLKHEITKYKELKMIGKVFANKGINLIYGESGSGKTVGTIKALNEDGITPILLDFDDNLSPENNECEYVHIDGSKYLKDSKVLIPSGKVIIVDTWQMFLINGGDIKDIYEIMKHDNTVIIVAHNKPIATKEDIPDIDHKYSNHFASKLCLEWDKGNGTKTNPRPKGFHLTVQKLRGYRGDRIIYNWMREDDTDTEDVSAVDAMCGSKQ